MSKIIALIIASLLGLPVMGTHKGPGNQFPQGGVNPPAHQGITVNKIAFTTVTDYSTVPEQMKNKIDQTKEQKGFYLFDNKEYGLNEEGYHLLVNLGQKPTTGYYIKVTAVEDNEGVTVVYVDEVSPKEDSINGQMVTYPSTLIKIKGVTPNVKIVSKAGSFYKNLNQPGKLAVQVKQAIYVGQIDANSIEVKIDNKPVALYLSPDLKDSYKLDELKTGQEIKVEYIVNQYKQNVLMAIEK